MRYALQSLRKYTRSSEEDIWVYSLLDMYLKLKEGDQELQRGYMGRFLMKYALEAWETKPVGPMMKYDHIPNWLKPKSLGK